MVAKIMDKTNKNKLIRFLSIWAIGAAIVNIGGLLNYAAGGRGDCFVDGMSIKDAINELYTDPFLIVVIFIFTGFISYGHVYKRKDQNNQNGLRKGKR